MMTVQFDIEIIDDARVGKLDIPLAKAADWINFLVSPRQQAQIVAAEQHQGTLTLYFQADAGLYAYLDGRFNCEILPQPQNIMAGSV